MNPDYIDFYTPLISYGGVYLSYSRWGVPRKAVMKTENNCGGGISGEKCSEYTPQIKD